VASRFLVTVRLPAPAEGFVSSDRRRTGTTIRLATTTAGAPRLLTLERGNRSGSRVSVSTSRLGDRPRAPRLFSDGVGFYAYSVTGDRMTRWTLTETRRGALSYRSPVTVRGAYDDLTALVEGSTVLVGPVEPGLDWRLTAIG